MADSRSQGGQSDPGAPPIGSEAAGEAIELMRSLLGRPTEELRRAHAEIAAELRLLAVKEDILRNALVLQQEHARGNPHAA